MPTIGITGHRALPPDIARYARDEIHRVLLRFRPDDLVGLSCLADGADTIFAEAVREVGGRLVVVVPAAAYRDGLPADHHPTYDRLLAAATAVRRLPYRDSTPEAHMAASRLIVDEADELVAVWDGLPARGFGGTADVVAYAREAGTAVTVIWPSGRTRD